MSDRKDNDADSMQKREPGASGGMTNNSEAKPKDPNKFSGIKKWKQTANMTKFLLRSQGMSEVQEQQDTSFFSDPEVRKRIQEHQELREQAKPTVKDSGQTSNMKRKFMFDDKALLNPSATYKFMDDDIPEVDFTDIVDTDDESVEHYVADFLVGHMINSIHFRVFIFALIVINSVLIGLQTDQIKAVEYRYMFSIFDQIIMAIFICEILLKWYYSFWIFWKDGWNILDFFIILSMVLGPQLTFLNSYRNLRILRVLRAFRSLRSIGALAGLSMVTQTMIRSIPDMANIVMLLCIILLVFGVMGNTLFATLLPNRFADLSTSMFSLFICVTQDGWVDIYKEFRANGWVAHVGGSVYLFFSILVGAFIFANLVVAVVVTNLEVAMKELKEERRASSNTLSTNSELPNDKDDFVTSPSSDKVNLVEYRNKIQNMIDLTTQKPLELTNLKGLSLDKLENYLFLLTVFEENLCEYEQLRLDLAQVLDVVMKLNTVLDEEKYAEAEETDLKKPSIADLNLNKGDIMSNLMKLQEKKVMPQNRRFTRMYLN